jgi:hypothetical protein
MFLSKVCEKCPLNCIPIWPPHSSRKVATWTSMWPFDSVILAVNETSNSKVIWCKVNAMISVVVLAIMIITKIIPSNPLSDLFSKFWKVLNPSL